MNGTEYESAPDGEGFADGQDTDGNANLTQRAGDVLQRGRDFLESMDPAELRADVEDTIRSRPLLAVCVAALAGFIAGRMIRD